MHFSLSNLLTPSDNGPIYRETTNLSLFIVEPWNAFSSLTFLIPAFIVLWQLRGQYRQYPFFAYFCARLLILGGLGSMFSTHSVPRAGCLPWTFCQLCCSYSASVSGCG